MRFFIALLVFATIALLGADAGITAEEFQVTAEANKVEKPVSFNAKGPTHSESLPMELLDAAQVRRHLSIDSSRITFKTDPNYEMKLEVNAALKGQSVDSFVDRTAAVGASDDLDSRRLRKRI